MIPRDRLTSHAAYLQVLKSHLPEQAFKPRLRKLLVILAHLIVVSAGYAAFQFTSSLVVYSLLALVIGHSLMCVVFLRMSYPITRSCGSRYCAIPWRCFCGA